jgi:hypothetical protein
VGSSAFDTPRLEMAEVLRMTTALPVGTLRNISFVVGRFKFDSALLKIFDLKNVFVVGSRFEVNEEHGEREFGLTVLDIEYISYGMTQLLNFRLDVGGVD